ncbi:MAG: GC-type dockerin domain-anchored protein [Phycisphaerales bacterium]
MRPTRFSDPLRPARVAAIAAAAGLASPALTQTVTVNTIEDAVDISPNGVLADLPGPDGLVSMREACLVANNMAGPQTIEFAIPQSQWWLLQNIAVLRLEDGPFLLTDDGTTIDFSSQEAFTGNTNPNGGEVGIYGLQPNGLGGAAISIYADNCTVKGLDRVMQRGYGVHITRNNNRVIGCTISGPLYAGVYISGEFNGPPASGNVVGGTEPGEANVLSSGNSGVRIDTPAADNVVIGNHLVGSSFYGIEVRGNPYTGSPVRTRVGGNAPGEGNWIAGNGKYGEEGFPTGGQVYVGMAEQTIVEGNLIGTTQDGVAPYPGQRGPVGVNVVDSMGTIVRNNTIGGIRVAGTNHAAGQTFGAGVGIISINEDTFDTLVEHNRIGTDPTGQNPVPNLFGVSISPLTGQRRIHATTIRGNDIAFSQVDGLRVSSLITGVRVTANSFHDNAGLAIDLLAQSGSGVTLNDPGDADTGANGLLNFPELESAAAGPGSVAISGALRTLASRDFEIEFYASPACDPSGHGEGARYLGSISVTTDSTGHADAGAVVTGVVAPGEFVTALTIDAATGDTSEFSACIGVTAGVCRPDLTTGAVAGQPGYGVPNGALNNDDFFYYLAEFAAGNLAVCDLTAGAVPGQPGYGVPNGVLTNDDFFYYLAIFAAGC